MAIQRSGQITVTTAGTAVQGTSLGIWSAGLRYLVKPHPDNTDTVWVGNTGSDDVSSSNGYPLNVGESMVFEIGDLNELWFDADVDGEKVCWFLLSR